MSHCVNSVFNLITHKPAPICLLSATGRVQAGIGSLIIANPLVLEK